MDPSASFELEPRTKTIDVHPDSKETKKVILINSIAIDPLSTCKGMQKRAIRWKFFVRNLQKSAKIRPDFPRTIRKTKVGKRS